MRVNVHMCVYKHVLSFRLCAIVNIFLNNNSNINNLDLYSAFQQTQGA